MPDSSTPAYMFSARMLHWVTAILVLTMIPMGIVIMNADTGPGQDFLFNLHRSIGVILLPIVVGRLIWRMMHPPMPLPADIPIIQRGTAHTIYWTLYALLVIQPIVGWIATSAYRAPIEVFWIFVLTPIWRGNWPFPEQLFAVHQLFGIVLAILICAHIGAALFHHIVRRDHVLMRMISS